VFLCSPKNSKFLIVYFLRKKTVEMLNFVGDNCVPKEKKILKEVCAWCKKEMGEKEGVEGGITHGMCPECEDKIRKENNMDRGTSPK
jgi:hypothetical protein